MTTVSRLLLSSCCLALLGAAPPDRERRTASDAATPATPAVAQPAAETAAPSSNAVASSNEATTPASGYVIYRDPVTGQIATPPASEIAKLGQAERSRLVLKEPLYEEFGRNGGTMVRLKGQFRHYMTVEIGKDGRLESKCAQDGENDHVAH